MVRERHRAGCGLRRPVPHVTDLRHGKTLTLGGGAALREDEGLRHAAADLLTDSLIEIVDDDWLITSAGIESRRRPYVVPIADLFELVPLNHPVGFKYPSRPASIDEQQWDLLVKAAHGSIPIAGVKRR
jgi:hypothetical protein